MADVYKPSNYNNYPNLTVEERWSNDVMRGYRLTANSGYVFYDTTANNTELDPDTDEEIPVTYYYTIAYLPSNFNFANFPWIAVPRDSVDENYIFGGGSDNNHEVM